MIIDLDEIKHIEFCDTKLKIFKITKDTLTVQEMIVKNSTGKKFTLRFWKV